MQKIAAALLIAATCVAAPAFAQTGTLPQASSQTWESITNAAASETDANKQMQMLRRALGIAKTPEEKFETNLNISYVRYQQGIFGESVFYAGEALKIADADIPNDSVVRTKAIHQKFKALKKVGREEEGWQLVVDDIKRNSAKSDHVWTTTESGPVHIFTNFTCPNFIAQMPRKSKTSYSTAGIDVGCGYGLISDKRNVVTVYFARSGKVSDMQAITHADQAMMNRLPEAKKIAFRKKANFNMGNYRPVYYTLLTTGTPQSGEQYTGAWSQVIGDWELSARVTWDSDLGIKFGEQKVEAVFRDTAKNVRSRFEACEVLDAPKKGKRVARDDTFSTVMFNSLLGGLVETLEKDVREGNNKPGTVTTIADKPRVMPKQPDVTCFASKTSGDEIALGYHPDANRRYSTFSAVIDDVFYVEKEITLDSLNEGNIDRFVLKMTKDGVESFYQVYDDEPNVDMVFEDIIGVVNGEIDALGSVSVGEDGNSEISINPDMLGGGKKK